MREYAPLLSDLHPQRVEPPLQSSAVNPPPLPQILELSLQRDVPLIKPLATHAPPPLPSASLQERGKTPIITSTVCTYVPLISALLLWKGVPLRNPSAEPAPIPQLSALPLQRGVPYLQRLAVCAPPPPQLSILLQGLGVPPLLPSAVCAYSPLLW